MQNCLVQIKPGLKFIDALIHVHYRIIILISCYGGKSMLNVLLLLAKNVTENSLKTHYTSKKPVICRKRCSIGASPFILFFEQRLITFKFPTVSLSKPIVSMRRASLLRIARKLVSSILKSTFPASKKAVLSSGSRGSNMPLPIEN